MTKPSLQFRGCLAGSSSVVRRPSSVIYRNCKKRLGIVTWQKCSEVLSLTSTVNKMLAWVWLFSQWPHELFSCKGCKTTLLFCYWKDTAGDILHIQYFLVNKSLEKTQTNNDLILLGVRIGPYKIESGIYLSYVTFRLLSHALERYSENCEQNLFCYKQ